MIKKTGIAIAFLSILLGTSCSYFEKSEEREVIAKVNKSFLYKDDIAALVPEGTPAEDSALVVANYITRWATQRLLIERAKVNLSIEQQKEFDRLVENYKNELYAKAYTDALISRQLDTVIDFGDAKAYYEENGENFRLNEDLVKLRYINTPTNINDFDNIKRRFKQFEKEDKQALLEMAIQFNSYSLNDSVWVRTKQVYDKIAPLSPEDSPEWLKKDNFLQLEDSLGVYLVAVEDVKMRGDQAPLEYALPGVEQILVNKRKLELIKELEKDIIQDAIKNEQFETFD